MEKKLNISTFNERIELMKKSNHPFIKKMVEVIEKRKKELENKEA